MSRIILVLLILCAVTLNAWGDDETSNLVSLVEGSYQVIQQSAKAQTYLDCALDKEVRITKNGKDLWVEGLSSSPIEFRDLNQGPVGIPGPLVGFSQRRTVLKSLDGHHIQLLSEHRDCEPLLSKLGCFGKKWRTTAEVIFYIEDKKGVRYTQMEIKYQPFSNLDQETCMMNREKNL